MDQSNQTQPTASTSRTYERDLLRDRLNRTSAVYERPSVRNTARKSTTYIPDSVRNSKYYKPKVFNFHHLDFPKEADESKRTHFNDADNTKPKDNQNNGRSN